jgi:NHL repeat
MKPRNNAYLALAVLAIGCSTLAAQPQMFSFITIAGGPQAVDTDGTNTDVRFNAPGGVALDDRGNIFVADTGNSTIRELARMGTNWVSSTIVGLAGQSGATDGTNGQARFNAPWGLAIDGVGDIYVADTGNHTIRKLTLDGTNWVSSTLAGLAATSGSADGTNSEARFNAPRAVGVDGNGNLYVADTGNATIRKLTPFGTNWASTTIAGEPGNWGVFDAEGFTCPNSLVVDAAGNIYVADCYRAIRKLTQSGSNWVLTTVAGNSAQAGCQDGANTNVQFITPAGIALDGGGNLYVADSDASNIRKLTPSGSDWISSTIAGECGTIGSADGTNFGIRLNRPFGISVDSAGNIYIGDTGNAVIRKLSPFGTDLVSSTIAGQPPGSSNGTDGTNAQAHFHFPMGIAVDGRSNVFVADTENCTIRKLTPVGTNWVSSTISGLAGIPGTADGTNGDARFYWPGDVAVDRAGNLFVPDYDTIRKLTPVGTNWVSSTIAGLAGIPGSADGTNSDARFSGSHGVAVDESGNVYVPDFLNFTIRKLRPVGTNWVSSTIAGVAGSRGIIDGTNSGALFLGPIRITVDGLGNLYVADHVDGGSSGLTFVRKVTSVGTNWIVSTLQGRSVNHDPAGDHGPLGLAAAPGGEIYQAEGNHTIQKIIPSGTNLLWSTVAGQAGEPALANGTNGMARFDYPVGIAADSAGNLYIADSGNNAIRMGCVWR